ncbi:peptidoglycan-recognition protein LC-like [Macrosteles quadrilineatus]|uniref:peptidoglycan-recognition protein LC-like n=1 Tax=Macrosteles quadrilineatus TaxID=74068 RepID=UPI0023E2E2EA|nr:peptidoglycan-recognition protein LC-like [Macrosteles quadrilineatus]
MQLRFFGRHEWGAKNPLRAHHDRAHTNYDLQIPVKCVIFGYTQSQPCYEIEHCKQCIRDIQKRNMEKYQLLDIRYNFLIDYLGNKYIGRGWKTMPSLPKKYRQYQRKSLYVGLIGFYNAQSPPSPEMYKAKEQLLKAGVRKGEISLKFLEFNI